MDSMAKKKKEKKDLTLDVEVDIEESAPVAISKEEPAVITKKSPGKSLAGLKRGGVRAKVKLLSFDQFTEKAKVKHSHKAGMRAFVKDAHRPRSLEDWSKLFINY